MPAAPNATDNQPDRSTPPLVINLKPEAAHLAVDLHEHLVQMPAPAAGFHSSDAALFDLGGEERTGGTNTPRFVAVLDTALVQQIFNVAQRKCKPDIHHDRQADDRIRPL